MNTPPDYTGAPLLRDERPSIRLAPFGVYTRTRLRVSAVHVVLALSGLLTMSLTFDLSAWLSPVLASRPDAGPFALLLVGLWYVVLRCQDLMADLLPIACYLGIFWAEFAHTQARERISVWNTGRTPLQSLMPVLLLGLGLGSLQYALEAHLRPWAVRVQSENSLGEYARFDRRAMSERQWFVTGNTYVNAKLRYQPTPQLVDLMLYRLGYDGKLREVVSAAQAISGGRGQPWIAQQGRRWVALVEPASAGRKVSLTNKPTGREQGFESLDLELALDPLWLSTLGINARFLPQEMLAALARGDMPGVVASEYQARYQVRLARAFLPLSMMLLAMTLCMLLLPYRPRFAAILGVGLVGYVAHVAAKNMAVLGEHGILSPVLAAWGVPGIMLCAAVIALWLAQKRAHV